MMEVSDYSETLVTTCKATCCYNRVDHNLNYLLLKGCGGVANVNDEAARRHIAAEADIFFEKGNEYKRIK